MVQCKLLWCLVSSGARTQAQTENFTQQLRLFIKTWRRILCNRKFHSKSSCATFHWTEVCQSVIPRKMQSTFIKLFIITFYLAPNVKWNWKFLYVATEIIRYRNFLTIWRYRFKGVLANLDPKRQVQSQLYFTTMYCGQIWQEVTGKSFGELLKSLPAMETTSCIRFSMKFHKQRYQITSFSGATFFPILLYCLTTIDNVNESTAISFTLFLVDVRTFYLHLSDFTQISKLKLKPFLQSFFSSPKCLWFKCNKRNKSNL